jgi:hypothetical protein
MEFPAATGPACVIVSGGTDLATPTPEFAEFPLWARHQDGGWRGNIRA